MKGEYVFIHHLLRLSVFSVIFSFMQLKLIGIFQIAKNNRLMVYRQSIKQEIAEGGRAFKDDDQLLKSFKQSVASAGVEGKKLLVKPCSSAMTAAIPTAAETKQKLLLLPPVNVESKKWDKDVDDDNNNISRTVSNGALGGCITGSDTLITVDDLSSISTTVDVDCCKDVVTANDNEEKTAAASMPQKGRKTGKKSAAASKKGSQSLVTNSNHDCITACRY